MRVKPKNWQQEMRRGYWGETGTQIHYREIAPRAKTDNGPLLCLPPAPHTGTFFSRVMPILSQERRVIAIDYPGYGGSDRGKTASIQSYANALASMVEAFGPVDLLGFHTGNLVAAEIAKSQAEKVGHVVMVDVPFFDAETRQKYTSALPEEGVPSSVEAGFEKTVTNRHASISEEHAFELWIEGLRSGAFKQDAFRAAFSYNAQDIFPKIDQRVSIIATQSGLLEPSRNAAKSLPDAAWTEVLDITAPAFEAHSDAMAKAILTALAE